MPLVPFAQCLLCAKRVRSAQAAQRISEQEDKAAAFNLRLHDRWQSRAREFSQRQDGASKSIAYTLSLSYTPRRLAFT